MLSGFCRSVPGALADDDFDEAELALDQDEPDLAEGAAAAEAILDLIDQVLREPNVVRRSLAGREPCQPAITQGFTLPGA